MKLFVMSVAALTFGLCLPTLAQDSKAVTPPAVPVCKWPDKVPFEFSMTQAQVVEQWATGQDYSHSVWSSISPIVEAQIAELRKKYCEAPKS